MAAATRRRWRGATLGGVAALALALAMLVAWRPADRAAVRAPSASGVAALDAPVADARVAGVPASDAGVADASAPGATGPASSSSPAATSLASPRAPSQTGGVALVPASPQVEAMSSAPSLPARGARNAAQAPAAIAHAGIEAAPAAATLGSPEAAPPAPAMSGLGAPALDQVRIARDGSAVIAGRGEPGAEVTLRVDGAPVATVSVDAQGQFAAVFTLEPSAAPRLVTVEMRAVDGTETVADAQIAIAPGDVEPRQVADAGAVPKAGAARVGEGVADLALAVPSVADGLEATRAVRYCR